MENKKEPSREYHWASEEELNENLRAKHRQENSCYGKWKTYWKGKHPLEWAVFVFTVGAFFAAAVAALYTKREWATAKAEEINQLRAYVFPSDQPVFSVDGTHQEVDFQIRWRNTGTTETRQMSVWITGVYAKISMPPNYTFPDNPFGEIQHPSPLVYSLLGPQETMLSQPEKVKFLDMPQINKGALIMYVWGWAQYYDVFHGTAKHITRFCDQISSFGVDQAGSPTVFWRPCDQGNCADDECRAEGIPPPS